MPPLRHTTCRSLGKKPSTDLHIQGVRPWKDHFKSDLRSDQVHRQKNDLRSDQEDFFF
jgi:hypothetical protein